MRSVSQIYSEAVEARNEYLQLTELDSGLSKSKVGMLNLLTYVAAVCIHTYEAVLDLFKVRVAQAIAGRVNGTPEWYAAMARKFQYDQVREKGDDLVFNEDTMKIEYETPDPSRRIIEKAAWQMEDSGEALLLKVCKASDESSKKAGVPCQPLTAAELTAFKSFMARIKFVGATVYSESMPGDVLAIEAGEDAPIFYDDRYVTASQAMASIKEAMAAFVNERAYNDIVYYQDIVDALQKTEHISYISRIRITLTPYDYLEGRYGAAEELVNRARLKSGYMTLLDERGVSTISAQKVTLAPASQLDSYK